MNEPIIALNRIDQLLAEWRDGKESPAAAYAATKAIIFSLKEQVQALGLPYALAKLSDINWHLDAMFAADSDQGRSQSEHRTDAMGSISVLKEIIASHLG